MRALEVDALPGGVGREEHLDVRVVQEVLLRLAAFLPPQSAVYGHDRLRTAEQRSDPPFEVCERVAVFGEDDEFLSRRGDGLRDLALRLRDAALQRGGREEFAEQRGEFAPFRVESRAADVGGEGFEARQRFDFRLQFDKRLRGGGLVEDLFLHVFDFGLGGVLEIVDVVRVEEGSGDFGDRRAPLQKLQLPEPFFEPVPAAAE